VDVNVAEISTPLLKTDIFDIFDILDSI